MSLTNEQRIEIILIVGSRSNCMVAAEFNGKHRNVVDQPRNGPRRRVTDE